MTTHDHVLRGRRVVLEPLTLGHAAELAAAIPPDDEVGTWTPHPGRNEAEVRAWIEKRLAGWHPTNPDYAFVQRDLATGRAMGSSSLFDLDPRFGCAEIGWTWLARPFRGTGANTEAKRLLLGFGLETLGLARVQIVTNARNQAACKAAEKIGATFEGVLRAYRLGPDGKPRDSAVFSVTAKEWPAVRARLDSLVASDGR